MRRDMDYCIKILGDLAKGEHKAVLYLSHKFTPEITEEEEIENKKYLYHLEILEGAGFIEYELEGISGGDLISDCPRLTWDGNDFLDMVENDTLWNKTKEAAKEKGFEVAKMPLELLVTFTKMKAKEMLGIEI
ncbi:DUF2513 domain-containing protein [Lysinibacillus fusiformis]|uniref:DUF2513 domain-containing protein n=1 Tax=Lysinibacillus fusiformis TaxID=28031 RepID=UPI002D79AED4|nr:DUF2513 domain-containing protein [Lysinibacillus fusiformis]WRS97527.1 DUF2513 domain-containing protein [Lysinibacillus fusiformis]